MAITLRSVIGGGLKIGGLLGVPGASQLSTVYEQTINRPRIQSAAPPPSLMGPGYSGPVYTPNQMGALISTGWNTAPSQPGPIQRFGDWITPGGSNWFGNPQGPYNCGPGGGGGGMASIAAAAVIGGQIPIVAQPQQVATVKAPPGYVIVCAPNGGKVAVLKEVAYALRLRKRPSKSGGITSRDMRSFREVAGFLKRNAPIARTMRSKPRRKK